MGLSNDLISQFVKATNDNTETKSESTVYGTIVEYAGEKYVKFDGSDLLTPITSTTNIDDGERVTVTIKNHTATVTGNISSPSARSYELILAADELKTQFQSTSGYNLIRNSTGLNGSSQWSKSTGTIAATKNTTNASLPCNSYMYFDNGTNTSEARAYSKRFKIKKSTTYTLSGWFHNYTKCPSFDVFVLTSNSLAESSTETTYDNVHTLISTGKTNGTWKYYTITFTTTSSAVSGYVRIDNNGYNSSGSTNNRVHWCGLILNEGNEQPWSPHPSEVYDGYTSIDANGVMISNGAITILNNDGDIVLQGDSNGNLTLSGTINVRTENSEYLTVSGSDSKVATFSSQSFGNFMSKLIIAKEYSAFLNQEAITSSMIEMGIDGLGYPYMHMQTYDGQSVYMEGSDIMINNNYIVSRGSANSGVYVRYYDGTQICWGIKDLSSSTVALTTNMANAVYSNDTCKGITLTFAAAFSDYPRVTSDCRGGGYLISQVSSVSTTSVSCRIWANYSTTSSNVVLQYIAVGKWK